ncbi:hypothetical protein RIF29_10081 [Crotalaria pallida]|uniref:Uncharacterized protein n=1 Tax=Crotalaria pallida TaxID=3830 RepID=A0AAN9II79_CROPI
MLNTLRHLGYQAMFRIILKLEPPRAHAKPSMSLGIPSNVSDLSKEPPRAHAKPSMSLGIPSNVSNLSKEPHYVFPLPYHLLTCDLRLASPFFSPAKSLLRSSLRRNRSSHPAKSLIVLLTRVFSENQNAFSASTELADTVNDNYWFVYD